MENLVEGSVSYQNSQNIYIRFESTKDINIGDTLFSRVENVLEPALVVKHISSISCVGVPLPGIKLSVADRIIVQTSLPKESKADKDSTLTNPRQNESSVLPRRKAPRSRKSEKQKIKKDVYGRLSISSYSNLSNRTTDNSQRMRYTFSLYANNPGGSKFSADTYITFRHRTNEWEAVRQNLNHALKVYSLAIKYDLDDHTHISIGRKINRHISNIGAIDGLQLEKGITKNLYMGAVAGSRPDYQDYSVNVDLFQFGAYIGHKVEKDHGSMESTFSFFEQKNQLKTDRRFAYFQHSNTLVNKLNMFYSFEVDLYKLVDNTPKNAFQFSSVYLSLRYRINRNISLFASYDARKNVIYYETFKNYIDRILENETRQGLRLRINYRPVKYLSVGLTTGYRFQHRDQISKNYYGYITYSRIPGLNMSATLTATRLKTVYLDGKIYGLRLSRDIVPGKLYGGLQYRKVDYDFLNADTSLLQDIASVQLSWRASKKISFSIHCEGTFEHARRFVRIYGKAMKRF